MTEKQKTGKAKKAFYVTTAIAYPNAKPHLGHALEIVQADVVARFHRLKGEQVCFQTGTDEHGLKNWQTAQAEGIVITEFLDRNVATFKELYKRLNISYDRFIRTTDKKLHQPGAIKLWEALEEAGDIYKQKYQGLYCAGCESFKLERELESGKCPNHPMGRIETVEEENYFFRLSKYKERVADLIKKEEYKVIPEQRKNEILAFLEEANDISFSRPKSSLPWGIPVPGDEEHVMYVWCDALSNYITGAGYGGDEKEFAKLWPADCHIIGKDILRFHAAFWPAMLLSANIPLPKELFVHGFILARGGAKMSKSTGNVLDPAEQVARYGADLFRFYLLESMPIDADGEYDEAILVERHNKELVSNLANFVYRTLSFIKKNYGGRIGTLPKNAVAAIPEYLATRQAVHDGYASYEFRKAMQALLKLSHLGNVYFQQQEPWKSPKEKQEAIALCANLVKDIAILASPAMPGFSEQVLKQLNMKAGYEELGFHLENHAIGEPAIIWTKRDVLSGTSSPHLPPERGGTSAKAVSGDAVSRVQHPDPSMIDLIVAKIVKVEKHPKAERLYIETLDDGSGQERVIVSGLVPYYKEEELLGKHILLVNNLKPANLRGVTSHGMLLAAKAEGLVEVIEAPDAAPGTRAKIGNFKHGEKEITIDEFFAIPFLAEQHLVTCAGHPVTVDGKRLRTKVKDGKVA